MKSKISPWAIIIVVIIVLGIAALVYGSFRGGNLATPKPELNNFAQCLTDQGWKMYGAYWCSHCQEEKAAFGSSFQFVTYVECTQNTQLCLDEGVKGYPTWISPTGEHYEGSQGLLKLSELSGCALPNDQD